MNIVLFFIAWILIPPLSIWNFIEVKKKYASTKGYFLDTAKSIDIWANREFRTLWNAKLRTVNGYEFGKVGETISSALGKNERDNTLTRTGQFLAKILNTLDKNHCKNSINEIF